MQDKTPGETPTSSMPRPLAGLRVLELARILAGPWTGQILADLGAEVIKIESPTGDDTRTWGPPFVEETGSASYFHAANRGKKSVVLDLATARGQARARALAARSDVMIENFKLDGLAKYGLDYPSLSALDPRLIYCSITGFGQTGPYAPRAGYDFIIQAMSGLMSVTGEKGGEPQKLGVAVADLVTGLNSVIAIQAALAEREKTGKGRHIDMALMDACVSILSNQALSYLTSGISPASIGNAHPSIVPYQVFAVSDGHFILAVGNDGQFRKACAVLGLSDLADDPAYATNPARVTNREALVPMFQAVLGRWTRDEILAACEKAGVPAGPINSIGDVFADPQVQARGMQIAHGTLPGVRMPILFDGQPMVADRPCPRLGEHTDEILASLDV